MHGPGAPGVPAGFGSGLDRPDVGERTPVHAYDGSGAGHGAPEARPGSDHQHAYDDAYDGPDDGDHRGLAGAVRRLAAEAAWRYRSAPMRVRVIADIAAASLILLVIVGVAIGLRQDGGPDQTTAGTRPRPSTTVVTTTTIATTTTLPPTTTTTAPTTTTTVPPTTTTTAAPVVPPPTEAPTTTLPPTTTTTEAVNYRSCRSARSAGALPLFAGQPGYGEHLDSDRDGEACDDYEDWMRRG